MMIGIDIDGMADEYPNSIEGLGYALDVLDGKVVTNIYIKGACRRFIDDLNSDEWILDWDYAEKYLRTTQKLEHVIGDWKTKNIVYEPWQKWLWLNILLFKTKDTNDPRFRMVHAEIARGNGKSALASQASLFFLGLDGGAGNQIATVATKREQARIVLDSARGMAEKNEGYLKKTGVKVYAHHLAIPGTLSKMSAMSADVKGADGLNLKLAVMDELHAMSRETFDVVYSGMSKRSDSITLCISTAGFNTNAVGYSQSEYAKKVALGEVKDEQFFSAVYTLDKDDDIFDERNWIKANPNWAVSVDPVSFRAKAEKAKITPADIPNFKVKHLNLWLSDAQAFFDVNRWDECADPTLKIEDFIGEKCRIGLDVSSHIDLTSFAIVFKRGDIYYVFDRSFIPSQTVRDGRNEVYETCIAQGYLEETIGRAIDQDYIASQVTDMQKNYKIKEVFFDPWNALGISQSISKKHIPLMEFRMTTSNFSEPTKKLDVLMREGKIRHNGSPLLRWCIQNVVVRFDVNDNVYPKKNKTELKIDPVIAIIMALAGWIDDESKQSVYNDRPIRTF